MSSESRSEREVQAYGSGKHRKRRQSLYGRFSHVYNSPNSQRQTEYFSHMIRTVGFNKDVLDVGCGTGWSSQQMLALGARSVDGVDISAEMLTEARAEARICPDSRGNKNGVTSG